MAKYNVVANGFLKSLIGPSYGNLELTYEQLRSLCDGNEGSLDVYINASDKLVVEIDLGYRLRLDSFEMYILASADVTAKIDFYYKDLSTDNYTLLDKAYNGSFYYADHLPTVFGPRYLMVVLDGIEGNLAEIKALNEDYSVGFGETGNQTHLDLRDSESSNLGDVHELKIKNNSSADLVHAYTCVDYTGEATDYYIKVSADNALFYGIEDGISIDDEYSSSKYKWSYGKLDNIKIVDGSYITLNTTTSGSVGTYTTQLFTLEGSSDATCTLGVQNFNRYDSSFFVTQYTSVSGSSLTVDSADRDYTMEIRSSNVDPEPYNKMIFCNLVDNSYRLEVSTYTKDVYTGSTELIHDNYSNAITYHMYHLGVRDICVDYVHGKIYTTSGGDDRYNTNYDYGNLQVGVLYVDGTYVRDSAIIMHYASRESVYFYQECSSGGLFWMFEGHIYTAKLYVYDELLTHMYTFTNVLKMSPSLKFSTNTVWLIHTNKYGVYKYDSLGSLLYTINQPQASFVISNYDGGCWVFEKNTYTLEKYKEITNDGGEVVYERERVVGPICTSDIVFRWMVNDLTGSDGLWYLVNNDVVHMNSQGDILSTTSIPFSPTDLKASPEGVLVRAYYTYNNHRCCFVDLNGDIVQETTFNYRPGICNMGYNSKIYSPLPTVLPMPTDPVWGDNGTLEWQKVPISGYYLPKTKYHQARITFRNDEDGKTSEVYKITIPKPVIVKNIPKNESRSLYIRTNFTGNIEYVGYKTRLKTWWHIEE